MLPMKPDGSRWCHKDGQAILNSIVAESRAYFHARDVARGLPQSGMVGRFIDDVFVVDPVLRKLKHSGEEHKLRVRRHWEAFCSEPRDVAAELAKIGLTSAETVPAPMRIVGGGLDQGAINEAVRIATEAAVRALMGVNGNGHETNGGAGVKKRPGRPRSGTAGVECVAGESAVETANL